VQEIEKSNLTNFFILLFEKQIDLKKMWESTSYDNAGGFYEQNSTQAGAQTPGGGEKKKRANNIVATHTKTVLDCGDDGLKIEGIEVGMVSIVGKILSTDHGETKSTIVIEDHLGTIEAVQWHDENSESPQDQEANGIIEGADVRIIGSVRTQQDKRYLMVFRVSLVQSEEEKDSHKLEVEHAKLLIRKMNDKENAAIGANNYGLSNSMMSSSAPSTGSGAGASFGNAKYDSIYKMVAGCDREEGMSRDELSQQLAGKMSRKDVDDGLEFLSNEGHIYSTTDEDHFKTTDS